MPKMASSKKPSSSRSRPRATSYDSLYLNPLPPNSPAAARRLPRSRSVVAYCGKENAVPFLGCGTSKSNPLPSPVPHKPRVLTLKPSSLQLCIQRTEPDSSFGSALLLAEDDEGNGRSRSENAWDYSDSEAAPASGWSALPNRSLLCRPLPLDIGRCTCVIVKEAAPELDGISLYTLYTNEGQGRQDRKLAVARHRRHKGRTEFTIAQNAKGIVCSKDESFLGTVSANLVGSRYYIWDQGVSFDSLKKQSKLLAFVTFTPTVATLSGSYRSIRAWIPKHQSMQLKSTGQVQHLSSLPKNWTENINRTHQLFSRVPQYNNLTKRYELDFRERGRSAGLKIRSSVKNFQLIMEENGKQTILQLGRIGKSKYVMDYRFPLTGYQAFCVCLASIDSKLCCSV